MIATATAVFRPVLRLGLIPQIVIGISAGVLLALFVPNIASDVALLGQLFIAALQAVAPILVFVLV
ncbi:serine/threonine transporter SstT, partial [Pollutimonas sp. H1-120]